MPAQVAVTRTKIRGFEAFHVANDQISFTIVPDLGGKLSSMRDLRSGREWLWTNPTMSYRRLAAGDSYVQHADTGGWDECFPTVAACAYPVAPWKGTRVPDHGEVWSQAWQVAVVNGPEGSITIQSDVQGGGVLPYRFQRAITLADRPSLHFDYRVTSMADAPLDFIWSAHPLVAVEPGMRVQIPSSTRMHAGMSIPSNLVSASDTAQGAVWPVHGQRNGQDIDLSVMPPQTAGVAIKLWSEALSRGEAAIVATDGTFQFTFDPAQIPQIGLWLNAGGWSGTGGAPYYNLALEPCIGAQDSLEEAVCRYGLYRVVPPHQRQEWSLDVHLLERQPSNRG